MFKLTPPATSGGDWTETVLYRFTGSSDGNNPWASLVFDSAGALYGTTSGNAGGPAGAGTVFKLTPPTTSGGAWTQSVLHSFCSQSGCSDGFEPIAGLIFDTVGALYGTTFSGGASDSGTVFKLTPPAIPGGAWNESVLYSFTGGSDGMFPYTGSLIFDSSGALYGTTGAGGNLGCVAYPGAPPGCGTVFKLTPPPIPGGAWNESVPHTFTGKPDGAFPYAGLVFDASGALYSTTFGGNNVFKLSPPATSGGAWTESVLYHFTGGSDGYAPYAGLIFDAAGTLYGTTGHGASSGCEGHGCGTVFEITNSGSVIVPPSEVATTASGLAYSHVSHTFNGTVTITNISGGASGGALSGPFQILFTGLTAGVTLANATGNFSGSPYLTIPAVASLAPGQSATVSVHFANSSFGSINFTPVIYSGNI